MAAAAAAAAAAPNRFPSWNKASAHGCCRFVCFLFCFSFLLPRFISPPLVSAQIEGIKQKQTGNKSEPNKSKYRQNGKRADHVRSAFIVFFWGGGGGNSSERSIRCRSHWLVIRFGALHRRIHFWLDARLSLRRLHWWEQVELELRCRPESMTARSFPPASHTRRAENWPREALQKVARRMKTRCDLGIALFACGFVSRLFLFSLSSVVVAVAVALRLRSFFFLISYLSRGWVDGRLRLCSRRLPDSDTHARIQWQPWLGLCFFFFLSFFHFFFSLFGFRPQQKKTKIRGEHPQCLRVVTEPAPTNKRGSSLFICSMLTMFGSSTASLTGTLIPD